MHRQFPRVAFPFAAIVTVTALSLTGCAKQSPAVGTWTGATPGGKSATVTLQEDGAGTVAIPPVMENVPIKWAMAEGDDRKVVLTLENNVSSGAPGGKMSLDGTLAEDGNTMTVKFMMFSLNLTKSKQ